MSSEAVVVRCPACQKPVGVPVEFLGQVVHCVGCRATFTAPVAAEGGYTLPVLIRRGRGRMSPTVMVPTVGLLLLGTAGMAVNGYLLDRFRTDPAAATAFARWQLRQMAATDPPDVKEMKKLPAEQQQERRKRFDEEQERKLDESAEQMAGLHTRLQLPGLALSAGVFLGGVAFALRRWYWLGFVACACAVLNLNHACCIPGAVLGMWTFFALISEEGRRHFRRIED